MQDCTQFHPRTNKATQQDDLTYSKVRKHVEKNSSISFFKKIKVMKELVI